MITSYSGSIISPFHWNNYSQPRPAFNKVKSLRTKNRDRIIMSLFQFGLQEV